MAGNIWETNTVGSSYVGLGQKEHVPQIKCPPKVFEAKPGKYPKGRNLTG